MAASRERILDGARGLIARGDNPTVEQVAAAAGVSKTSFYRAFASRRSLLEALDMEPERGARERILEAAMDMVGTSGLAALSMDELALEAGVSRATLYRLFPGKAVLFASILREYSPLEPVSSLVESMRDQPPEVVMPEIARVVFRTVYGSGAPRIGMLRAVMLELTALSPDSEEAARELVTTVLGTVGAYVMGQMAAGRLRPMHPILAMQSLVGAVFFHLLTREFAERLIGLDVEGEEAVTELARNWLRGMKPDEEGEPNG